MRSAVVLPQPDGPTSTTNSPSLTSRLRSRTAGVSPPYTLLTWMNWISAIRGAPALAFDRAGGQPEGDPPLHEQEEDDHR